MLVIRLQRTGRKNLPAYRIVVAEKHWAVKKRFIDIVGHYLPTRDPKVIEIDTEKVSEWIKKGAKPSDTVAALCKNAGMSGMEKYMDPRNKKRAPKNPEEEPEAPAPAADAGTETPEASAPEAEAASSDNSDSEPEAAPAAEEEPAKAEPEAETPPADEPEADQPAEAEAKPEAEAEAA